jgi:hypothetical protein
MERGFPSSYTDDFVRLNTQAPLRMRKAILHGQLRIALALKPIHRLKKEVLKVQVHESLGHGSRLREHQLQLATAFQNDLGIGLWADANPVQAFGRRLGAIGFHGYFEPECVQRVDQRLVELQQRFATGADNEWFSALTRWPMIGNSTRQIFRGLELSPTRPIRTHKLGIAELAYGSAAILLSTRPEVATRKPAKDRRATGLATLALQGVVNLFD